MSKYLSYDVPKNAKKASAAKSSDYSPDRLAEMEKRLNDISEQFVIQNRDNLDAMYNIGIDNLDSDLTKIISETGNSIAYIKAKTDENSASIQAFAQWKDGTGTNSLAGFVSNATKDFATVSMLSQYTTTNDVNGLIETATAGIVAEAQQGMASVSMVANVVDANGKVNAASIVAAVNDSGSSVIIEADKIDLNGYVTYHTKNPDTGETSIYGSTIELTANSSGKSTSSIEFLVYSSYADDEYVMARIETRDNGSSYPDEARRALVIQTNNPRFDSSTREDVAFKVEAKGSISLESANGMVYVDSYNDIQMVATSGVIRLAPAYYGGDISLNSGEYTFCADGIYYGSTKIVEV